jgi:hypothetical protein
MRGVVPVPAYTDPHNPAAAGGSINFGVAGNFPPIEEHPVEHSPDYGGNAPEAEPQVGERDEWTKAQWEELAESYDLPKSGTKDELIARVQEHEAALEDERNGE